MTAGGRHGTGGLRVPARHLPDDDPDGARRARGRGRDATRRLARGTTSERGDEHGAHGRCAARVPEASHGGPEPAPAAGWRRDGIRHIDAPATARCTAHATRRSRIWPSIPGDGGTRQVAAQSLDRPGQPSATDCPRWRALRRPREMGVACAGLFEFADGLHRLRTCRQRGQGCPPGLSGTRWSTVMSSADGVRARRRDSSAPTSGWGSSSAVRAGVLYTPRRRFESFLPYQPPGHGADAAVWTARPLRSDHAPDQDDPGSARPSAGAPVSTSRIQADWTPKSSRIDTTIASTWSEVSVKPRRAGRSGTTANSRTTR